jgi:hypothetical protein
MPMTIKEQAALTAFRDELRKIFEPCGARVEQFELQLANRCLKWRSRTPDLPSHHVGGAFEEWTTAARVRQHRALIVIVRDEDLVNADNASQHARLFESLAMPERIMRPNIWTILQTLGIEIADPIVTVIPATGVWMSRH